MWIALALTGCTRPAAPPVPATTCANQEILDGETCVPEACGTGTWGDLPVDDATVFVDVDAADGGDGSEASPLTSLQGGVDLAGERGGGLVAVARGTYLETVSMGDDHKGVTLAGRCEALVAIDGSEASEVPTVQVLGVRRAPAVALMGLELTRGTYVALWVEDADVTVQHAVLSDNASLGVLVLGDGKLGLTDVTVTGTTPDGTGAGGYGALVEGGTLDATDCLFEDNTEVGVFALHSGTVVNLDSTSVLETRTDDGGGGGHGIEVADRASLTAAGCTIRGNAGMGVAASNSGTEVVIRDSTIADTRTPPSGTGNGIGVQLGASLSVTGCIIEGNAAAGIFATDSGTTVDIASSAILGNRLDPDATVASGLQVQIGASMSVEGSSIEGSGSSVLVAVGSEATLTVTDSTVAQTAADPDGLGGYGVEVAQGASLVASGCAIEDSVNGGMMVADAGSSAEVSGCAILGTRRGRVLAVAFGLAAQGESQLTATDTEVSGGSGPGLYVTTGASLACASCTVSNNSFAGAVSAGGTLQITGSRIEATRGDGELGGGFGVYTTDAAGASGLTLTDSTIGSHPYAAVWLDGDGTFDIERNQLSGSAGLDQNGNLVHGNAVFAENGVPAHDGSTGLLLRENGFSGASTVAVLLDAASATLEGNTWSGDVTDLRQQRCAGVTELSENDILGVPTSAICPAGNVLTAYDLRLSSIYLPAVSTEE